MQIAIGTDHRGFAHKEFIKVQSPGISWLDVGCNSQERCDYPPFAASVVRAIKKNDASLGILLCGSGIGMAIAANRFSGIFAGLVWNAEVARKAKEDDNVNILVLPADFITLEQSVDCINAWLSATSKGGRYEERRLMIEKMNL